ncbi:unnamed protein product [Dracunculus medinensis]|uniref:HIG1 domain-containing protein n=1 Tax=Dracunculus medinensis TaxID=318479 RepID=A0A0N4U2W8_DRAME|nr:unnamed protein product [Dracunculus medinensis]
MGFFRQVFMQAAINEVNLFPHFYYFLSPNSSAKTEESEAADPTLFQHAANNPAVILGLGLTSAAIFGMIKATFSGDRPKAQKYMRYRIIAQFFTVTALAAGFALFSTTLMKSKSQH